MTRSKAGLILALLFSSSLSANPEMTVELPGGSTMELVWVEPGTFTMGLSDEEQQDLVDYNGGEDYSDLLPPHEVTISTGFWIGKYEVTVSQWEAVMARAVNDPSREPEGPVSAAWLDIDEFLWRLNAAAGDGRFRLPTEAEWEYAARAGTTTIWSFGSLLRFQNRGRFILFTCASGELGSPSCTWRVGQRDPNPWGLYDVHGNAPEMTSDAMVPYSAGAQVDPFVAGDSSRVIRGNSAVFTMSPPPAALGLQISANRQEGTHAGLRILMTQSPGPLRADAGRYRWAAAGEPVVLDGSGSVGSPSLSYTWEEHPDNLELGVLDNPSRVQPVITAHRLGEYRFSLTVSDGMSISDPHDVVIEIVRVSDHGVVTAALKEGVEMDFVWIEPGPHQMGFSKELERLLRDSGLWNAAQVNDAASMSRLAQPAHDVTLTRGFYLARYEMTQGQWTGLTGEKPWVDDARCAHVVDEADVPAVCVSYDRLGDSIGELNRVAHRIRLGLPTEAQWEHAALTGSSHLWSFGSEPSRLDDHAWYAGNASGAGARSPRTVGEKLPNRWGLHDMDGNVSEWCLDQFAPYDETQKTDPAGPFMPAWDRSPVQRGGNVELPPISSRERFGAIATEAGAVVGARLVLFGPPMPPPVGVARYELDEDPPTLPLDPAGYPTPGEPLVLFLDQTFDAGSAAGWRFNENRRGEESVWHEGLWSVRDGAYRLAPIKLASVTYHGGPDLTNYTVETRIRVQGGEGWVVFTHADENPFWRLSLNQDKQHLQLLVSQDVGQLTLPPAPGDHEDPRSPLAWTRHWTLRRSDWHDVRIDVRTSAIDVYVDGVA
ncbi:MAG: formylglycine-generating enzyme family protein, partial [Gemmatimonadetes bacterium]|nr:formylglycine-generating enzyme family protein [Gemmatimonadota bacterium]